LTNVVGVLTGCVCLFNLDSLELFPLKLPIISILSGVALATLSSGAVQAAIVVPPTGLAPGSEYRLVFVTSDTRDATSTNIADYNTFVQNAARSSSALNTALTAAGFNPTSINWTAIASTSAVNARVNTATQTTDTSRPIYRLDGALVATGYADLWDGSIGVPINLTELGSSIAVNVSTGTRPDGASNFPNVLGTLDSSIAATVGGSGFVTLEWVAFANESLFDPVHLYGISSVLTVPTATATTPEPSSLLGFITLGGLMLGGAVRRARK
jgi:hypothetical protein